MEPSKSVPAKPKDNATFAAIKAKAGGKAVAAYFGDGAYTDKSGLVWQTYQPPSSLTDAVLARVRAGLPLLINAPNDRDADADAQKLSAAGAFHYDGLVGGSRAPWMGSWYFVRTHPVYDSLRVDGKGIQIIAAYGRDHDRNLGAGTFTAPLGLGAVLFQCMPPMHPAIRARWLANSLAYLAGTRPKGNP